MTETVPATEAQTAHRFVLGTKIAPPPLRHEHIDRERLFVRLDEAVARPLTLVSAPTGFGKTTLLAAWARRASRRTAWLTITAGDSDTVRLAAGIVASLRRAGVVLGDHVDRDLVAPGIDVADEVLPKILGSIDGIDSVVLVLDDYHLLSGAAAHHLVETLVSDLPASLRVVIASRADPSLPLGRLRAMGSMVEIRADQLRFDPDEADQFLNGSLCLDLDPGSVKTLEARTEGWPAGLYLAALTLRDRTDRARFVSAFAGSSRHVVDYLSEEVLDGLSADDRTFLLWTSILGRLSGPLCDVVTGMSGSAARLRDLERANLFIVPLDESGTWFRYHRLFAELLRSEVVDETPELVPELHRRAARWHAEQGLSATAIEHALVAGDRDWAATLLVRSWRDFARIGQFQTFERLLAEIGPDRGALAGPLAAVAALMAGFLGREPDQVAPLVAAAESSGWVGPTPDGWTIDALVSLVKGTFIAVDLEEDKAAALALIERYGTDPDLLTAGRTGLAMILTLEGDPAAALAVLEPIELDSLAPNLAIHAAAARSTAVGDHGDPPRAERIARETLTRAEHWGLVTSRVAGALWLALGSALAGQRKPHEAIPPLERALQSWGVPGTIHRASVLIALGSAFGAIGERAKARAAAREARAILTRCPHAGILPARLEALERRLRIGADRTLPQADRPTEAEIRVLRLLATSRSAREIASQLFISINTVKTHTKALHRKLGTSSRDETVARARELGLL